MHEGIITHGDGVALAVASSDLHVIDQTNHESHFFTHYAAFDPGSGRRYFMRQITNAGREWTEITAEAYAEAQEIFPSDGFNQNYRATIGCQETGTSLFVRNGQLVSLLNLVAAGRIASSDNFSVDEYIHVDNIGAGRPKTIIFCLLTLRSRSATSDKWYDFPEFLQRKLLISRKLAWRISWALVRASLLDRPDIAEEVWEIAKNGKGEEDQSVLADLDSVVLTLKGEQLT